MFCLGLDEFLSGIAAATQLDHIEDGISIFFECCDWHANNIVKIKDVKDLEKNWLHKSSSVG